MNKQEKEELVNQLNGRLTNCPSDSWDKGYNEGLMNAVIVVRNMHTADEPKKVKVKQYVADWYEEHKHNLSNSLWEFTVELNEKTIAKGVVYTKFESWFIDHPRAYEVITSMENGYEIEEERKFEVIFPNLTGEKDLYLMKFYEKLSITSDRNFYIDQRYIFTEKEIKSIDERYWAFAVPVEKV